MIACAGLVTALMTGLTACADAQDPKKESPRQVPDTSATDDRAPAITAVADEVRPPVAPTSLNQAFYKDGTKDYIYALSPAIPNMPITGAPLDADGERWEMLHDGSDYRLYFFKRGTNDTLYQFVFNPATAAYEYVTGESGVLRITGARGAAMPVDADPKRFAMLYDKDSASPNYRLYMRSKRDDTRLLQFSWNGRAYEYGYRCEPVLQIAGGPADADHTRWAMLHDGSRYRYYALKRGSDTVLYQYAFNPETNRYEYGFDSIPELAIKGFPANSDTGSFAMVHSGTYYSFYFQTKNPESTTEQPAPAPPSNAGPRFPVDLDSADWYGLTYPTHDEFGRPPKRHPYQYSAIDLNASSGSDWDADNGKPIYAIEDGVLEVYSASVALKHTKPLVLKNGTSIPSWYSLYGHLRRDKSLQAGDTITKGTVLGWVSNVNDGEPLPNHLHFALFRSWSSDRAGAISPYWLPGPYSADASLYVDDPQGRREPPGLYEDRILTPAPTR